jgi:hypothetical protein
VADLEICPKCDQVHTRCAAHKKGVVPLVPCMRNPKRHHKVCPAHGGNAPQIRAAAERRRQAEAIGEATQFYAIPVESDPNTAMNDLLRVKTGEVLYLKTLVNGLDEDDLKQIDRSGSFEKPAVWVEMLWVAQRDLREICRVMFDVGFAERQARYVDSQAMLLQAGLLWFRRQLGLENDPNAEAFERQMLAALAQGTPPELTEGAADERTSAV